MTKNISVLFSLIILFAFAIGLNQGLFIEKSKLNSTEIEVSKPLAKAMAANIEIVISKDVDLIQDQSQIQQTQILQSTRLVEKEDDQQYVIQAAQRDFSILIENVLSHLPRKEQIRKYQSQNHTYPSFLKEAAAHLADIAEAWTQAAHLKKQALNFYKTCALEEDFLSSVRALCLNRALRLEADLNNKLWDFNPDQIPARIIELAQRI